MTDSSLTSFYLLLLVIPLAAAGAAYIPGANRLDVRWGTMIINGMILVCAIYCTLWMYKAYKSLELLNKILIDQDLRPELKGAVQLLRQRLREIWKWGLPND